MSFPFQLGICQKQFYGQERKFDGEMNLGGFLSWVYFPTFQIWCELCCLHAACSLIMPIATGALISSVSSCPSHPPFQVSFQLVAFPAFLLWGFKESTSRLLRWSSSFQLSPSSSPSHLAIAQVSGPSRAWSCISSREGFVTSAVRSNKSMICLNQVYFPPKKGMPWMLSPFTETESESPVCFQSHFPLPFLGGMAASPTLMFSNMTCAGPNWG